MLDDEFKEEESLISLKDYMKVLREIPSVYNRLLGETLNFNDILRS
jgi:hypothetical protein